MEIFAVFYSCFVEKWSNGVCVITYGNVEKLHRILWSRRFTERGKKKMPLLLWLCSLISEVQNMFFWSRHGLEKKKACSCYLSSTAKPDLSTVVGVLFVCQLRGTLKGKVGKEEEFYRPSLLPSRRLLRCVPPLTRSHLSCEMIQLGTRRQLNLSTKRPLRSQVNGSGHVQKDKS